MPEFDTVQDSGPALDVAPRRSPENALAPSTGGLARGHSPLAGDLLSLQGFAGNRAVTSALMVQRDGPPGSAGGALDAAVGGTTAGQSLTASATIAGGQTLSSSGGKIIHTNSDTTVRVSVTTTGLSIDFSPSLTITKEDAIGWIDVDIDLTRLSWNFTTQMLHAEWTAANAVNWFGGVGDELFSAFNSALNQLPARTNTPGYNPFTDPDLATDLTALVGRLSAAGGGAMPRTSNAQIEGSFAVSGEITRDVGHGVTLVIPSGMRLTATASLAGGVPSSAGGIRISSVVLSASGGGPNVNLRALGQDWPVVRVSSVTLTSGAHVSASYTIIHEDIGTLFLQLLATAVVQENPLAAGEIRDDLSVHDQAAHRLVDQMVRDNAEPALRDAIRANARSVPGLNLADVFGVTP
ncbi:hypothetical protein [Actinocrispum wychmicini]|nr:hypothetical protein [Actinocrispum wychmicini]